MFCFCYFSCDCSLRRLYDIYLWSVNKINVNLSMSNFVNSIWWMFFAVTTLSWLIWWSHNNLPARISPTRIIQFFFPICDFCVFFSTVVEIIIIVGIDFLMSLRCGLVSNQTEWKKTVAKKTTFDNFDQAMNSWLMWHLSIGLQMLSISGRCQLPVIAYHCRHRSLWQNN